jgi:diadenosine tetraphosphate (Ap4A) HIT family hydrolase
MDNCSYCAEFAGDIDNSYYLKNVMPIIGLNRVRLESLYFYIFPSVGSLIPGHLLIVPKRHYTALSMATKDEIVELEGVISELQSIYKSVLRSSSIFYFEHGILDVDKSLINCVDHAHLHILPAAIDTSDLSFRDTKILNISEVLNIETTTPDYIFFGDGGRSYISFDQDKHAQYLRKIVHEQLKLQNHWNWRSDAQVANIKSWIDCLNNFVLGQSEEKKFNVIRFCNK